MPVGGAYHERGGAVVWRVGALSLSSAAWDELSRGLSHTVSSGFCPLSTLRMLSSVDWARAADCPFVFGLLLHLWTVLSPADWPPHLWDCPWTGRSRVGAFLDSSGWGGWRRRKSSGSCCDEDTWESCSGHWTLWGQEGGREGGVFPGVTPRWFPNVGPRDHQWVFGLVPGGQIKVGTVELI